MYVKNVALLTSQFENFCGLYKNATMMGWKMT